MRRIWLCVLLTGLLVPSGIRAQTVFYTHYQTAQGLPANEVRAVTRDSLGFLWVATDNGLARFDGRTFSIYQAQLESRYVKAFAQRPRGEGFLLANDAGVFAVEPTPDTASIHRVIPTHPRPTDSTVVYPNGLHYDRRGDLWISQPNGSVRRWRDGTLRRFSFGANHTTGTSDSGFVFANDAQGRLWMAASTGRLYRYRPEAGRFRRVSLPRSPERVHDLRIRNDTLWLAGTRLVQARVTDAGRLERVRTLPTGDRTITHLAIDAEGLLLGTKRRGLVRGTYGDDGLVLRDVYGANDPHRVEQLPFRSVHHVYAPPDGPVWLSSAQGLGLLQSPFFTGVPGLAPNNTLSVYPDDGRVLVSIGDVYEVRFDDRRTPGVRVLPASDERLVTSLATVGDTLWMGTANGRLLATEDGRTTRTFDYSDRGSGIFYATSDRRGNLWFCQAPAARPLKGVSRMAPDGTMTFYGAERGVENRILVLEEGPHGSLYAAGIGPDTYLFRYQPDRDRFLNLSLPLSFTPSQNFEVHDLAVDEQGLVWLATTDGLLRYDLEHVERVALGAYTRTEIRSVETMPDGGIWLATDTRGLLHYRDGTAVQFSEGAGLPTKVTVYRTLRKDRRGRLWIGTAEGTVRSSQHPPAPKSTPTPRLLSARVGETAVPSPDRLSLRAGTPVTLRYTTLTFPGNNLTYEYRLTGAADPSWSEPTPQSTLRLRRLPIGEYHLVLRAHKGSGHYWSAPLRVPVDVAPVWYRTWWAYLLLGGGGAGVVAYLLRRRGEARRERIDELEATLDERETLLHRQEEALERQREAIEEQTEELDTTDARLAALYDFVQTLSPTATWPQVLDALPPLLETIDHVDAIEFGYYHEGDLRYDGYARSQSGRRHRREDFDERTKLPAWALFHDEPVHVDDFRREHAQYLQSAEAVRAPALLCVPFELRGRQQLVLVVSGAVPHAFDENDRRMAHLLARYLAATVREPLTPTHETAPDSS
jgi:ligand-binding sensor domain-containing protein/uncharacterized coiled-coil protein SlyX